MKLRARPHLRRWIEDIGARPAVERGQQLEIGLRASVGVSAPSMMGLYGQK